MKRIHAIVILAIAILSCVAFVAWNTGSAYALWGMLGLLVLAGNNDASSGDKK